MEKWTEEEMKTKMNKIHNMDCLEFMKQVPDNYFDLVLTDPPYNVGIDYGLYKDNLSDGDYILFIESVLIEIIRISKNIIVYPPKKYFLEYWSILGNKFQQIVFTTSTAGSIRYKHKNQYTSILLSAEPNGLYSNHYHNIPMPHDGFLFRENKYNHKGYTSNALIRLLLRNYTQSKYKVFDPFMGTGSVAVVSKENNIDYCGTELETDYCEIANKRLSKVQTSIFAFMDDQCE